MKVCILLKSALKKRPLVIGNLLLFFLTLDLVLNTSTFRLKITLTFTKLLCKEREAGTVN